MAGLTHKLQYSTTSSGGTASISGNDIEAPNAEISPGPQGVSFPAGSVNAPFTLALTAVNLTDVFLVANQDCVIKTNSTSSPGNTITLVAGIPLAWGVSAGYFACPFTANVTDAFLTCTAATTLKYLIGTL
jgi:hypothetical protein